MPSATLIQLQPKSAPQSAKRKPRQHRSVRLVGVLSFINLACVALLYALLRHISESWWLGSLLTYVPRLPFLAPSLLLVVSSIACNRRALWINAIAIAVTIGPVMGLVLPLHRSTAAAANDQQLTIVSCNVQRCEPDFPLLMTEVTTQHPDVVAFQEYWDEHPLLPAHFGDWHSVHVDEYWVGSKHPVRLLGQCESDAFSRITAIAVEVDAPSGPFIVVNLHQTTARLALESLTLKSLIDGEGREQIDAHTRRRETESAATREFIASLDASKPLVVVGDFNMPVESSLYRMHWGALTNAFDAAGFGFGYTASCRKHGPWPENNPWLRIDHILFNQHWRIAESRVGSEAGSDHRLVTATASVGP